jgi:hypothetical protein
VVCSLHQIRHVFEDPFNRSYLLNILNTWSLHNYLKKAKRYLTSYKTGAPLDVDGNQMETRAQRFWNMDHHLSPFIDFLRNTVQNTMTIVKRTGSEIANSAKQGLKDTMQSILQKACVYLTHLDR